MSYSYNRTASKPLVPWGFPLNLWMESTVRAFATEMNAILGGRMDTLKPFKSGGVFIAIDEAGFSGDLLGQAFIGAYWFDKGVSMQAWVIHPQRGTIDLLKKDLDQNDRPQDLLDSILKQLRTI